MENELSTRIFRFSVRVAKYMKLQPNDIHIINYKKQILKSASSVGANYEESQGGCTRRDFHNKIAISLKEARETKYWLKMFQEIHKSNEEVEKLIQENIELIRILTTIHRKTKPQ